MSAEAARKTRVCIVGAGAAGLYASHLLRQGELAERVEILHFEADAVIGGRVRAHVDPAFSDFAVEMGAEEVHGEKSMMYRLANSCPTVQIVDHGTLVDDFYWMNGKLLDEKEAYKDKELKKVENFEEWLWKYKGPDMTVEAAAMQRQIADRILPFLEMENGAEHGTDNSKLSVVVKQENDRLWKAGEKNFVLKGAPMLDVITHKCGPAAVAGVRLRHAVTAIDFSAAAPASESGAGSVRVTVRDLASGADTVHTVDKVLVTVSLGVLQARAIAVSPPLPADVQQLIDAQGIDAGIKLTLKFKRRFWPKYMGSLYGGTLIHEFWTPGSGKGQNFHLTAFVMGRNAAHLSALGEAGAIDAALNELSVMFGDEVRATFDSAVFRDWGADPLFRGAYSYPRVGSGGLRARLDLARPHCDERLYFAGEGVAAAHPACVFGAMESAQASVAAMRLAAAAAAPPAADAAESVVMI